MPKKALFFLDKFVKVASALGVLLPRPIWFPESGVPLQTRVCFLAEILSSSKIYYNFLFSFSDKTFYWYRKRTNSASFCIQTLHFLLVGAQKYCLPRA